MMRDEIIAAHPIVDFVKDRGHDTKRSGGNFMTSGCPVTQHRPGHCPVTIYPVKQTWYCHDCKVGGSVIDYVMHEENVDAGEALIRLGGGRNGSELGELVEMYDYVDRDGHLLYQACRYQPKNFRQRRPDGKDGWLWNLEGVPRVPYKLPAVIAAQTVAVAEGEKDCDNLARLGFMATTNCGGAGKWRPEYSEALRDKDVVVFGDEDEIGREHVEQVIGSLMGVASSVRRVALPDGFHDVSDYIAAQPKDAAAQAIAKLIEDAPPVLNSVNSSISSPFPHDEAVVDDFPKPPSEIVFHGLAGDIVRKIGPHTEADPVAVLIQVLTAFGNVIGRSPHATADGSRHGTNIYSVLVGESSKSRKGTSLQHAFRVFGRADEDWRNDCIANGLSSGEGLIWAVRDPITKTTEDKETREPRTEVVDAGVADKRICVIEGELANVLKVMTREGNTLSPMLRAAWDSGNLRTLTKNSPARATEAHVSIIAHITKCELCRLLPETDQGNGFANRFVWVAVRRSKCLPEGGNIGSENFNDLETRLRKAIEFARNAGEVTRDEGARELWRFVYQELSEGKPGMLGAITARGEAQVLRLSCLYALLDCSTKISVDHHRAALALWNYCERSAKWIFGDSTGDARADRILGALRSAGRNGLTQTEISERVFNRNISSSALADSLRLLKRSGQIKCVKESTGGAPRTRWIATAS